MSSETNNPISMQESLTNFPDRFSDDAWSLLLTSQEVARKWKHSQLDVEHLLQVLFNYPDYIKITKSLPINNDDLLDRLDAFLADQPMSRESDLFIGEDLEQLLEEANRFRSNWGSKLIELSHVIGAIGRDQRIGAEIFEDLGLPSERLEAELRRLPINSIFNNEDSSKKAYTHVKENAAQTLKAKEINSIATPNRNETPPKEGSSITPEESLTLVENSRAIDTYGKDLTAAAREGKLDPVIGRDLEIRSLIKVLCRRSKNNPVLTGPPGVGKTAIAELLAQQIVSGQVPDDLRGLKLIALDLGALIAGAKFRGQFEERFRAVLAEVSDPNAGVILFIDELHSVISGDRASADAGNILKPILARGDLRCIGATTTENYRRTVEKDPTLNRRFQKVHIKEPTLNLSIEIVSGLKENYELHHGIKISEDSVIAANRLSDRYISDRYLPDKAIDLIDEAAAQLKMELTSKPQIIEDAEAKVRELKLTLSKSAEKPQIEIQTLNQDIHLASSKLDHLQDKWETEISQIGEIKILRKEEEDILDAIYAAESSGNLEEAAKLKYNELHELQQRRKDIEEIFTERKLEGHSLLRDQVEAEDIADVVARWTGIPTQRLLAEEKQKLLDLEKHISERVIGQSEAVTAISASIRRARAGMQDPRRPVGSFLFLGPTGVGKTELAKALADALFDEEEALIRLDMSEFMERNAVARLLGAPPGYVGYEEGGQLTEAVRQRPYAVILLDELEKAHPDVFNVLLQVLDDGRLTDSQGRTVDFRHTVIVMTSNLASRAIIETARSSEEKTDNQKLLDNNLSSKVNEALEKQFRPEFLNRIDEIIRFRPLQPKDLEQIVSLQLKALGDLLEEQGLQLRVDDSVIKLIASQGYEPEYGARPLRRVIRRQLENPLATELLADRFNSAYGVRVEINDESSNELIFLPEE